MTFAGFQDSPKDVWNNLGDSVSDAITAVKENRRKKKGAEFLKEHTQPGDIDYSGLPVDEGLEHYYNDQIDERKHARSQSEESAKNARELEEAQAKEKRDEERHYRQKQWEKDYDLGVIKKTEDYKFKIDEQKALTAHQRNLASEIKKHELALQRAQQRGIIDTNSKRQLAILNDQLLSTSARKKAGQKEVITEIKNLPIPQGEKMLLIDEFSNSGEFSPKSLERIRGGYRGTISGGSSEDSEDMDLLDEMED